MDGDNLLQYVTPKDIRSYGLIPEIIGRLPVLTHMNPLDAATLKSILTEPKNALVKQYQLLFDMDGIALTFTAGALDYIVSQALEDQLGARGLRSLCEAVLTDAMYALPQTDTTALKITKAYVEEKLNVSDLPALKAVS